MVVLPVPASAEQEVDIVTLLGGPARPLDRPARHPARGG